MLELGAGRESSGAPNVVRTDAFVFSAEHLDVVADAHQLPFQQLGDRMLTAPGAYDAWRQIAPSVELLARRR